MSDKNPTKGANAMLMQPVTSSNIKHVGYSEETRTLIVEFKTGTYTYDDVPYDTFTTMMDAHGRGESIGKHFNEHIRGHFDGTRVPAQHGGEPEPIRQDHRYEPGAYGCCRRCGDERKKHAASGTL